MGALPPSPKWTATRGLVFGTFDSSAPSLRDYLGETAWYLDAFFDRREGGTEAIPGVHKWEVPANWKLAADNFCGDSYHVAWTHLSAMQIGMSQTTHAGRVNTGGRVIIPADGNVIGCLGPNDPADPPFPETIGYDERHREETRQRLGPRLDLDYPHRRHPVPQLLLPAQHFYQLPRLAPPRP